MNFSFVTAPKIIFKSGAIDELGSNVNQFGKKFLIVTDKIFREIGVLDKVEKQLEQQNIEYVYYFGVIGEPDVSYVDEAH